MDINEFNSLIIDLENIIEKFKKEVPELYHQNYDYFSQLREIERKNSEISFILLIIVIWVFLLWVVVWEFFL